MDADALTATAVASSLRARARYPYNNRFLSFNPSPDCLTDYFSVTFG